MAPVKSSKVNRKFNWNYDHELCMLRNEVGRLFQRFEGHWRVYERFHKLVVILSAVLAVAFIAKIRYEWPIALSPLPQDVDSRQSWAFGSKIRSELIGVRPFRPAFGTN